jgi:hypothetical protein
LEKKPQLFDTSTVHGAFSTCAFCSIRQKLTRKKNYRDKHSMSYSGVGGDEIQIRLLCAFTTAGSDQENYLVELGKLKE